MVRSLRYLGVIFIALATSAYGQNARRTVVVSDTHFGVGDKHPFEDFLWSNEWRAFLDDLCATGIPTDLILNGDTIELWQSLGDECRDPRPEVGCKENEALSRLRVVINAHRRDLEALREFADHGANRVVIVPGNHDAALLYSRLEDALIAGIGAKDDRVTLAVVGYWRSADGLIHAEHGHQADASNRFTTWPHIKRVIDGETHLERPWGEQFVQWFYNELEGKYPIIDNIITESDAARFGLAAEGWRGAPREISRFASFIVMHTTLRQSTITAAVSDPAGSFPQWNVALVRRSGPQFFVDVVAKNDPARRAMEQARDAGVFNEAISELTDEEIVEICNERAVLNARDSNFVPCPRVTAGMLVAAALPRGQDRQLRRYLNDLRQGAGEKPPKVVVFAHTHDARQPDDVKLPGITMTVVNTGAWQRLLPATNFEAFQRAKGWNERTMLQTLTLRNLAACYSFADIPPYKKIPKAELKYWNGSKVVASCRPTISVPPAPGS